MQLNGAWKSSVEAGGARLGTAKHRMGLYRPIMVKLSGAWLRFAELGVERRITLHNIVYLI